MSYDGRCYTCEHWSGDRIKLMNLINSNGEVVMDKYKGFAGDGSCGQMYQFIDIEIHGDAYAVIEFSGSFGCIYWERFL